MRRPAVLLLALLVLATAVACQSDDPRPAYTYRAGPPSGTSAGRLPPPSRRLVAAPSPSYATPAPARPRRAST